MRSRPVTDRRGRFDYQKLGGGTPPPPFSPADVAGLVMWHDVRDQVVVTGPPDRISDWGDQVGTWDFTQATSGNRPLVGAINSVQAPDMTGSSIMNTSTVWQGLFNGSLNACTIYIVCRPTAIAAGSGTFGYNCNTLIGQTVSGNIGIGLQQDGLGGYRAVASMSVSGFAHCYSGNSEVNLSGNTLVQFTYGSGSMRLRVNNKPTGTPVARGAMSAASVNAQGVRIGLAYNLAAATYFTGQIGSILVYAAEITGADDTAIRAYLASIYGVIV